MDTPPILQPCKTDVQISLASSYSHQNEKLQLPQQTNMASKVLKRSVKFPPYADNPVWSDVIPLPQDDGGPNPLAAIAYTEEYSEAMAYLRAVMARNEFSDRALKLTEHIIALNPAHYTVWYVSTRKEDAGSYGFVGVVLVFGDGGLTIDRRLYRAKTLFELNKSIREEMNWLNEVALRHQKNYQIWHHRQVMMEKLGDPSGEEAFITQMFQKDAKNYHVWSYRQWLVRRFNLWDTEFPDVEKLLRDDVRNNSAWNHRYFIVFGREAQVNEEVIERELEYTKHAIVEAPQNESPWNYLRGVLRKAHRPLSSVKSFSSEFADLDKPNEVRSSHALDLLADVYAEEEGSEQSALKALDLLAEKYDPIRSNYWNYKKGLLGQLSPSA
ncbi:MAG: CAAX geranylgeranyltransferase alpha subunit [Sclerophora amabilis]|nr:MAG: CAAX geranylgeranyltransferase alpha subunit [Sclerophora amabilis]